MILMLTIFKYDSPRFIKQRGQERKLREFLYHIYTPQEIQNVIDDLDVSEFEDVGQNEAGYGQVCCNSQYSQATFVGIMLSVFQ